MAGRRVLLVAVIVMTAALGLQGQQNELFSTSDRCIACHSGLRTAAGEVMSIGSEWSASMMANAARDPYWHAAVRREVTDHPSAAAEIEHECSACHMPMARYEAKEQGHHGRVFAQLPAGGSRTREAMLSADGVSCAICHRMEPTGFGDRASFTAGFSIDGSAAGPARRMYGPYQIDAGRNRIMRSATDFTPSAANHLQSSEMCATCHTLFTHSLRPDGTAGDEFPEQVPYLEWKHSGFAATRTCQSCHMPRSEHPVPISSVMGEPRESLARHTFRGSNFFMARMLDAQRLDLGVTARRKDFEEAHTGTLEHLRNEAATVAIANAAVRDGRLEADVVVENLAGHKLPTAYPSRRVWVHFTLRDGEGRTIFESGAFSTNGSISNNDNDSDPLRFEPHYTLITEPSQVQIYETVMIDATGAPTTGLLKAVAYAKDNRILPRGFDKASAEADVRVHGDAASDADFIGGSDRVRYSMSVDEAAGPFTIAVQLYYQPIAFRWAHNFRDFDAEEPRRFVRYYEALAAESAIVLASAEATAIGRVAKADR